MPDEVADAVRADRPGAQQHASPVPLEHRQHGSQEAVHHPRGAKVQTAAKRGLHVQPVALADAHDDTAHLREVVEQRFELTAQKRVDALLVAVESARQRRRLRKHVHGQVHRESVSLGDVEQRRELVAQRADLLADLRLVPLVVHQVRHVVQRDRIETERRHAAGKGLEVLANRVELRAPLVAGCQAKVLEGDFRPVDALALVAAEERADAVDDEQLHRVTFTVYKLGHE